MKMEMLNLSRCRFSCKMMDGAHFSCPVMRSAADGELPRRNFVSYSLELLELLQLWELVKFCHDRKTCTVFIEERASNTTYEMRLLTRQAQVKQTHSSCTSADHRGGMSP